MYLKIHLVLLFLIIFCAAEAQTRYDTIYLSSTQAKEDLTYLQSKIEKNYKPYDLPLVKEDYLKKLLEVKETLTDRISISDFRLQVVSIIDELREAHFQVGFKRKKPNKAQRIANSKRRTYLPFQVSLQDSFLRVHYDYRPDSLELPIIDSIYAIDSNNIRMILKCVDAYRFYDIMDTVAKNNFMANFIPYWYRAYVANYQGDSVSVHYVSDGIQKVQNVVYVNRLNRKNPDRYQFIDSLSTSIITIGQSIGHVSYSDSIHKPLIKYATQQLPLDNPKNVIIDLRGCLGGSARVTRKWLSLFLDDRSEINRENKHSGILIPFLIATKFKTGHKLKVKRKAKTKNNYQHKGATYVITNEDVFSGGVMISSILQRYGKATIVGQPSAGRHYGTNAGFNKTRILPNSNIVVSIPQLYLRMDGKTGTDLELKGVQPDLPLPYDYDANNTSDSDATVQYILDIIDDVKRKNK